MRRVLETAQTIARYKAAVLITGETGSGKEVVARLIHRHSERSSRPWIDVNCAALPEHLVESELFGHEKGAFSGADAAKPGLFEMANGGTLFLDEIGEIDPRVQVKLLRVLDSIPFYRLGGTRKVAVDVRLIAATNRDLEAAVKSGEFRRDLYHRITEFHVAIPPLRERPLDIVALAAHFLAQLRPEQSFRDEALELLTLINWPGNVRELRNFIARVAVAVPHELISADDVHHCAAAWPATARREPVSTPAGAATITEMERLMILRTLEATGGNQSLAAQQLGIPRRTFCRKLNEHHITLGRRRGASSEASSPLPEYCRAELTVPVTVTTRDGRSFLAQARNLSVGGLGLECVRSSLAVSDQVGLTFALPDQAHPIRVKAEVMWCRPDGTAGTRFAVRNPATSAILRNWIADTLQQQARSLVAGERPPAAEEVRPTYA
jgi:MoxR-like ATPase